MNKEERFLVGVFIVAALLSLFGLLYSVTPARAASDEPTVCRVPQETVQFEFHIPAAWNDPALASWTVLADGLGQVDETTYIADPLTKVDTLGEGYPDWQYKIKVGGIVITSGDYSMIVFADAETPFCDASGYPVPAITPEPTQNGANANVSGLQAISQPLPTSSAAMCVIKYPQIILVCNR